MISLITPYVLTLIGIVINSVHDFPAMAVVLTVVGVLWTSLRCLLHKMQGKEFLIYVGGHGLIWLLFDVFPGMGMKLVSTLLGILVSIVIIAVAWIYVLSPMFSNSDGKRSNSSRSNVLPDVIYDSNNNQWFCSQRYSGGVYDYRSADGSRTIRIYHAEISGSGANTSEGYFHWY
jgi:hypothetical protein